MTQLAAPATQTVAVRPVVLPAPGRGDDLQVRVTAPTSGTGLPVVLFAHGFAGSMDDYDPLVDHWAGRGLVVVQPTFLDSAALGLAPDDPRQPTIWSTRVEDLVRVLDHLGDVLAAVPGLAGRVDADRVAVAGHSWGAQSVGMLLGARVLGEDGAPGPSARDPRVRTGVLLAAAGTGEDLVAFARERFAFMHPDYSSLDAPVLVVAGDADQSALTTRGPDWFTDAYALAPGATHLLTLAGGEHSLGGIQGHHSTHTTDEDPARVALVARASAGYLRRALGLDGVDGADWGAVVAELGAPSSPGAPAAQLAARQPLR